MNQINLYAPFKGRKDRPYDQAILNGFDWYGSEMTITFVKFNQMYITQDKLSISAMLGNSKYSADSSPRLVYWNSEFYIEDGHHRLVTAALRGIGRSGMAVGLRVKVYNPTTILCNEVK